MWPGAVTVVSSVTLLGLCYSAREPPYAVVRASMVAIR